MRIVVLGAGLIGVSSAWYLAQAGHEVTVIERQPGAGLETSFANGAQISAGQAEPWANPHAPATILKWLGREDAPLLFRLRADWEQWRWGLKFLHECLPARTARNTRACLAMAVYSRALLKALRADTGIAYDHLSKGILLIYTDTKSLDEAQPYVESMARYGFPLFNKSVAQCVEIEPALTSARSLVGGVYSPEDESGDAHAFTQALAALCAERGVVFRYDTRVARLRVAGGAVAGVDLVDATSEESTLTADAYVLALGCFSAPLAKAVGEDIPIYPVKGYSVTVPLAPSHRAPTVCLTDMSRKMAFSRLGERMRVAGTAELNGYDLSINQARCNALLDRLFELFPQAGDRAGAQPWAGLRPATPGNVPVIGRSRYANLYFNTGHGTLGWTMACGSGRAIADIASGKRPEIEFPFRGLRA